MAREGADVALVAGASHRLMEIRYDADTDECLGSAREIHDRTRAFWLPRTNMDAPAWEWESRSEPEMLGCVSAAGTWVTVPRAFDPFGAASDGAIHGLLDKGSMITAPVMVGVTSA